MGASIMTTPILGAFNNIRFFEPDRDPKMAALAEEIEEAMRPLNRHERRKQAALARGHKKPGRRRR